MFSESRSEPAGPTGGRPVIYLHTAMQARQSKQVSASAKHRVDYSTIDLIIFRFDDYNVQDAENSASIHWHGAGRDSLLGKIESSKPDGMCAFSQAPFNETHASLTIC